MTAFALPVNWWLLRGKHAVRSKLCAESHQEDIARAKQLLESEGYSVTR